MSPSARPSPIQPPFSTTPPRVMAQVQTERKKMFPLATERYSQGLQLAPIHARPAYDDSLYRDNPTSQHVQLPPIRIPHVSSSRSDPPRAIPVAQLLSSYPPSPPHPRPPLPAQPLSYRPSPTSSYASSPVESRPQIRSFVNSPIDNRAQPPSLPSHRLDRAPAPYRQSTSTYQFQHAQPPPDYHQQQQQQQTYPRSHPPSLPPSHPAEPTQPRPQPYSPALSGYSSNTSYKSHSDASPQSPLPPLKPYQPPKLTYKLTIRQQPVAARACGFGERDRRVIDPPPILELKITDPITNFPEQDNNATFALCCNLLSPDSADDETELPPAHPEQQSTRRLMGQTVASAYQAKDEHGVAGTFFVFPDLSCRSPGRFRLRFKMLRVDPMHMMLGAREVASAVTDVFSVYTAKDFPGMRASSALLKALRRQGLCVGVKKGSEARKGKGKSKGKKSSGGSENSDDDGGDRDSDASDVGSLGGSDDGADGRKKGKRRKTRD